MKKSSSASLTDPGQNKAEQNLDSAAVNESDSDYSKSAGMDRVDAINQIFAEFEFAYHNQFHKAFADPDSLVIAKKYWLSSLENYSPQQIVHAAKHIIRSNDYLPSIAAIVTACESGLDLFGLPSARQAYIEACSANSPRNQYPWSHQAVYRAGQATGWFLLSSEPESRSFPLFEYHYSLICKKVMKGEKLDTEQPTPITQKIEEPLEPEELHRRIAKMRKELGL
ncbi:MAG: hypothetical protein HON60_09070 [Gammaproteobacteria bacterium]|nr:hypothetical protein [Gammaproteobacteria bacterium]